MKKRITTIVLLTALLPNLGIAHPGHGHGNPLSPGHYVLNPEHSIPILLSIAIILTVALFERRRTTIKK